MNCYNSNYDFNEYSNVKNIKNVQKYADEVELNEYYHNNHPVKNGVINSPYYFVKVNGKEVKTYATRSAHGIHSFVYISVENDINFNLKVEVFSKEHSTFLKNSIPEVDVLPLSNNIKAQVEQGRVCFSVSKLGSYSLAFNQQHLEPITVFITKKDKLNELFVDYQIQYINPDDYSTVEKRSLTEFTKENTVYYFKKGKYVIDRISLPSNSILYLENGAYLEIVPSKYFGKNEAIFVHHAYNVKFAGRGIIDFSACCGGETASKKLFQNKSGIMIRDSMDIEFTGITIVNCSSWTLNFVDCERVHVKNVMIYGYRVFSDGIMLSDCVNGLVEDCFVRTGDDAFEVKSIGVVNFTDNVLFRNNAAWTDKAQAYGSIYECNHGTKNVRFENCSVGFALATWSDHVSCCVIQLGNLPNRVVEDIHFKNIEIYKTINASALNLHIGGTGSSYFGYGIIDNIYFENITIKHNAGAVLRLRTSDDKNCKIGRVYLKNIINEGEKFTQQSLNDPKLFINRVVGGYDTSKIEVK